MYTRASPTQFLPPAFRSLSYTRIDLEDYMHDTVQCHVANQGSVKLSQPAKERSYETGLTGVPYPVKHICKMSVVPEAEL